MRVHNFARSLSALLLLIVTGVSAQQKNPALTNGDILTMVKGGLQEATVLNAIAANETDFDVSAKALLDLKQAGISDKIIDAMLAAEAKKRNAASAASASVQSAPTEGATPPGPQDAATAQALAQMGMTPQMLAQMPAASRQQMMMAMSQMRGMNGMAGMPGMGGPTPMVSSAMPKIALLIGTEKKLMTSSLAQMAQSKTKGMSGGGCGRIDAKQLRIHGVELCGYWRRNVCRTGNGDCVRHVRRPHGRTSWNADGDLHMGSSRTQFTFPDADHHP